MWHILSRERINLHVLIRYSNTKCFIVPNFAAHPDLFIPVGNSAEPTASDRVAGILIGFTSLGDKFRNVKLSTMDNIYPFLVAVQCDIKNLVLILDIFFLTASLIWTLRANQIPIQKEDVWELLKEMVGNMIVKDTLGLNSYITHLLIVPLRGTED